MRAEICQILLEKIDVEVLGIELDPHQEQPRLFVGMLVGVQDVAAVPEHEVGNGRDLALAVRAGDQEDSGILHRHCGADTPARWFLPLQASGQECPLHMLLL